MTPDNGVGVRKRARVREWPVKFGFVIPNNWGFEDPGDVIDIATSAEQMGFHSVWVNHHVLHAGYVLKRLDDRPYYDALTTLTYVAALTKSVRLGTSVLVLPYLNPVVLAKSLATLDVLSGGRLTVGAGVGALRHESDSLGSDYSQRGAYTDESISVMKALWTQQDPVFEGAFYTFSGVKFAPKPLQQPHPPLWIGGQSRAAMRRAARLGDGWHPTGLTPQELAGKVEYLESQVKAAGRSMSDITISVRQELDVLDSPSAEGQGSMIGAPDQLLSNIEAYASSGVQEIVTPVSTSDVAHVHRVMEAFATKVMPRARD